MWKSIVLLIFSSIVLTTANNFGLEEKSANTTVEIGADLEIFCKTSDHFGYCTFSHSDHKCEFQWKRDPWSFTNTKCEGNPFGHPAALIDPDDLYMNRTCGIRLTNVTTVGFFKAFRIAL